MEQKIKELVERLVGALQLIENNTSDQYIKGLAVAAIKDADNTLHAEEEGWY